MECNKSSTKREVHSNKSLRYKRKAQISGLCLQLQELKREEQTKHKNKTTKIKIEIYVIENREQ